MINEKARLFIFGYGNSSRAFVRRTAHRFDWIGATTRRAEKAVALKDEGIEPFLFDGTTRNPAITEALRSATHLLISVPPGEAGDPVLACHGCDITASPDLAWIGYLSTVGVYGDHAGAWIDETAECRPVSLRSKLRRAAEEAWQSLAAEAGVPVMILRLAGIYGPGHNVLSRLKAGTAKRMIKPGQVFNRIHVDDIAAIAEAAADRNAGGLFNGADNEPAPPQDVVTYGAALLGLAPPPEQPFVAKALSPMARSFYGENKRISNAKAKAELDWRPLYPSYREGLTALFEANAY